MRYCYTNNMRTLLAFLSLYQHLIEANESVNQHSFEVWRLLAESEIEHSNAVRMLQGRLFDSFRYYNLYERFLAFAVKEWDVLRALTYLYIYMCTYVVLYRQYIADDTRGGGSIIHQAAPTRTVKKCIKRVIEEMVFRQNPQMFLSDPFEIVNESYRHSSGR